LVDAAGEVLKVVGVPGEGLARFVGGTADSEEFIVEARRGAAVQQGLLNVIQPLVEGEHLRFEAGDEAVENEEQHQGAVGLRVLPEGGVPVAGLL
jgi:hypothetical protein